MPADNVRQLLMIIDQAYDRVSWHGTNLRGSIRGLSAKDAAWRPRPGRHNIWEVVVHAAYWKYAVRRMITGERRGSFREKGSNWFRRPVSAAPEVWRSDVALLLEEHRKLRRAAAAAPAAALGKRLPGSKDPTARLLYSVAFHDVYHAGQIQLLKTLQRKRHGT